MKIAKNTFVILLAVLLIVVCFVSTTFSWYSHNGEEEGKSIHYADNYELSIKTANISAETLVCDKNGIVSNETPIETVSVATHSVTYLKTTLHNPGSNDVIADLETLNLPNNADFSIGTYLPTINEKAFASRAVRTKANDDRVRVYFKTNSTMSSYWAKDDGRLIPDEGTYNESLTPAQTTAAPGSSAQTNDQSGTNNDINLSYTVGGKEVQVMMLCCPIEEDNDSSTNTRKVYYYDIPSNSESFYFFNHWYLRSSTNREWNRTLSITDLSAGKLYYLTGKSIDGKEKEYKAREVDDSLVALNSYYKNVRMSTGESVTADIGLKKDNDTEDEAFVPDYFGKSIAYSIKPESGNAVSVNKDGLLMPKGFGSAVVETTITGKFGDTRKVETAVDIPNRIEQVPIIKNVRIPAGKTVDVYWYARNNSNSASLSTTSIIVTL